MILSFILNSILVAIAVLMHFEALTGLVLISWTASFMFIEMQKHWNPVNVRPQY